MKFCINVSNISKSIDYRLKSNMNWQNCKDSSKISNDDYVTSNRQEIIDLQKSNLKVIINNIEYTIDPKSDLGLVFGENDDLFYTVYGFYENYPSPPDSSQLKTTLINGNNNIDNKLVLKTDGKFYLVNPETLSDKYDPEIVLQFETFHANNNYVGPTIQGPGLDSYIAPIFKTAILSWKTLLTYHILDDNTDEYSRKSSFDDIVDVFEELNKIKSDWTMKRGY